jgi:Glycosyl hydrolases related to GH101 family, GH129
MRLALGLFASCGLCFGQAAPVAIETTAFRFEASAADGSYRLSDKAAGVIWTSAAGRFGQISVMESGRPVRYPLAAFEAGGARNARTLIFHPVPNRSDWWVRVSVTAGHDNRSLDLAYEAAPGLRIEDIRLLDEAFSISAADKGYVVVPVREGLLIPVDSGVAFTHHFATSEYEGCHMNMIGLVKSGAAMLVTWTDPYVVIEINSAVNSAGARGQKVATSAVLTQSAKSLRLQLLGKGDYISITAAYREVARANGLLVKWDRRIRQNPERAKYLGASNVKLWHALERRMNEDSTQEISAQVNWTFDEAAQVAEHVKSDLKMEKVLFGLGGWMKRGYDNQHPDILPTAPELGGDGAFADCARRVMKLGYLFSPHDNYQDMYRDSPSWGQDWITKTPDGSLVQGGYWNGGRAYITCSQKAIELARRPGNLPAVKKIVGGNSYFIDTTYAVGLFECFDPKHPLTKTDDIEWKQALSDYAREMFGSFGSEDGREWAIPHADFFEGITGVSGTYFADRALLSDTGGVPIPLFELVYHDAIAAYGKYNYDAACSAEYVLEHMILGRPLNYHNVPNHVYWKGAPAPEPAAPPANGKDPALFVRADNGWAQGMHPADRFMKNTHEVLSPLNEITGKMPMTGHEFLTNDRKAQRSVFSDGRRTVEVVVNTGNAPLLWKSELGGAIELPVYGFLVESPDFVAFRAQTWNGRRYTAAPIFTLRSLDGKPLAQSGRIKVFHAMGDAELQLRGHTSAVVKEAVLELP